jgi:hypothetical protein
MTSFFHHVGSGFVGSYNRKLNCNLESLIDVEEESFFVAPLQNKQKSLFDLSCSCYCKDTRFMALPRERSTSRFIADSVLKWSTPPIRKVTTLRQGN